MTTARLEQKATSTPSANTEIPENTGELLYCKMWGCATAMRLEDSYKKQGEFCSQACYTIFQNG